jgi:hypothetical protein
MDLRSLSTDSLKEIVHGLLEKGEARTLIDGHPLLAANVPLLKEAREAFSKLLRVPDTQEDPELERSFEDIETAMNALDDEFDHAARAANGLLSTAADVTTDEALAARYEQLRAALFPRGMTIVNLSAAESSGVARTLSETVAALSDDDRALLGELRIVVGGQSYDALALLQKQISAGRKLGKLAAKREAMLAKRLDDSDAEDVSTAAFIRHRDARNLIVKTLVDFRNDVERARDLTAAARQTIIGTMQRLARARAAAKKSAAKPTEPVT